MGHWKRLIKIPGGTNCYYWINDMTCLIHVCYLVTVPDNLSAITLHGYFVTLPGACYTFCGGILRMFCIANILFFVYLMDIITVYAQHRIRVILHMHICMFTSITSPLYNLIYGIKLKPTVDITR